MNRTEQASLHSGFNTRGDGWRAYEAVHPINQETRPLGADAAARKYAFLFANVWRSWRGGDPPCEKKHSSLPPIRAVNTRHVMQDTNTHACTLSATITTLVPVIAHRQPVTQRLHSSGLTLSCLARIATRDGPPQRQRSAELSRPSLPRLPVARPWG